MTDYTQKLKDFLCGHQLTFCYIYFVINLHTYPSHCLPVSLFILMPPCIPSLFHLVQVVYYRATSFTSFYFEV